jgi:hypothetical protein
MSWRGVVTASIYFFRCAREASRAATITTTTTNNNNNNPMMTNFEQHPASSASNARPHGVHRGSSLTRNQNATRVWIDKRHQRPSEAAHENAQKTPPLAFAQKGDQRSPKSIN